MLQEFRVETFVPAVSCNAAVSRDRGRPESANANDYSFSIRRRLALECRSMALLTRVTVGIPLLALAISFTLVTDVGTQAIPDFSGTWELQETRSGSAVDVWGQTRAISIIVTQSSTELSLATTGGGLSVPQALQRYRLDGVPLEFLDDSLGDLGAFIRKVRTTARWAGDRLTLETEPFGETMDGSTGKRTRGAGSITRVWMLQLSVSGDELQIERTGYRALPPALLHGRP
jgi:hypothetical protein